MAHKSKKEVKHKTKSRKQRHHTKISQKVIQKVIVKIGEERKAKKARRKQKRRYKREEEDAILQQSSPPPTIVYNTGGAYQPLSIGQTLITPQPKIMKPEYVEVEQPSGIIDVLTKKEQLIDFIDPVAPPLSEEKLSSTIYTEPVFKNQEKVEGNYSFGMPDVYSEKPPSTLYDNETAFQPRFIPKDIAQELSEIGLTIDQSNSPFEGSKRQENVLGEPRKRRTKEEIAAARSAELHALYIKSGLSGEKADSLVNSIQPKDLPNEIKRVKAEIKSLK